MLFFSSGRRFTALCALLLSFLFPLCALGESLSPEEILPADDALLPEEALLADDAIMLEEIPLDGDAIASGEASGAASPSVISAAREDLIDRILSLAESLYRSANGKPQRAQYSGDIYICKNFTVHLFRESCADFRIAAYPDVPLVIPNNLPKADCAPYVYGIQWQEVSAQEGNPFYPAASFRYDESLSAAENRENARAFLMQAQRGDYFQMAANYYYGVGAHSMIFIADYDPETDTVRWTDSNMKGQTINGERYAYVQYDAVKEIDWFVDAFCRKKYGATIYRLREDIVYADDAN